MYSGFIFSNVERSLRLNEFLVRGILEEAIGATVEELNRCFEGSAFGILD